MIKRCAAAMAIGLAAWAAGNASAQTGPELLLKPWDKNSFYETQGDAVLQDRGHTDSSNSIRLTQYETSGRVRLPLDFVIPAKAEPRFGWEVKYWDVDSTDARLPRQLTDTSAAIGLGILDQDGWVGGLSLGVGYAGAGAFDDGNGYYGKADFVVGKTFADGSAFGLALDYNGNRTFLPDIPLPGFAYTRGLYANKLKLTVGFPFTSIEWKPIDEFRAFLQFDFPDDFTAQVEYLPIKQLGFFAGYDNYQSAFHDDDLANSRDRLIFYQRRVEAGVKVNPAKQAVLTAAVGYAFSQEFTTGWDTRNDDHVTDISDKPYLRVGFELKF